MIKSKNNFINFNNSVGIFNSEPGDTVRNDTIGGSLHWEFVGFIADSEYITVLNREKHLTDNREYKEKAWFVSLGYQIIDPLLLTVRYKDFSADKLVKQIRFTLNLSRRKDEKIIDHCCNYRIAI